MAKVIVKTCHGKEIHSGHISQQSSITGLKSTTDVGWGYPTKGLFTIESCVEVISFKRVVGIGIVVKTRIARTLSQIKAVHIKCRLVKPTSYTQLVVVFGFASQGIDVYTRASIIPKIVNVIGFVNCDRLDNIRAKQIQCNIF